MTKDTIAFSDFLFRYDDATSDDWKLYVSDFRIQPGEVVIISGDNMSGKSTFLNILSGLIPIAKSGGNIRDGGGRMLLQSDLADQTMLLSSDDHMFPELSVADNIVIAVPRLSVRSRDPALKHAQDVMEASGIFPKDYLSRKLGTYSSGGRALVKLGRAYVSHARIIIVDEISSFLDQSRAYYFLDATLALAKAGRSVVIVSHNDRDRRHILSKMNATSYYISRDANQSRMDKRDA